MEFFGGSKHRPELPDGGGGSNPADEDRRIYVRFAFRGTPFPVHVGDLESILRLKDLSCGGAAGLTELPLTTGDIVYVDLDKKLRAAAEVLWVRRLSVGIKFVTPLDPMVVRRVHTAWSKGGSPFA
jgi:hypothetical protein